MKPDGWRQDVAGGIAATLYALPIELIYGRILVAPLGSLNYISGIQAVLWTSVMAGLLAFVRSLSANLAAMRRHCATRGGRL